MSLFTDKHRLIFPHPNQFYFLTYFNHVIIVNRIWLDMTTIYRIERRTNNTRILSMLLKYSVQRKKVSAICGYWRRPKELGWKGEEGWVIMHINDVILIHCLGLVPIIWLKIHDKLVNYTKLVIPNTNYSNNLFTNKSINKC